MRLKNALIALAVVLTAQAQAQSAEELEMRERMAICGDNILCYFSAEEINEALGPAANMQGIEDNFRIEDKDLMTDISARRKGGKSKAPKMSGGGSYKGVSPIGARIWPSFLGKFKQCAKGCIPYIVSVHRPGAVSCHNGGRAIDVGGLVCGGSTHMAINGGKYNGFVSCMKGKMKTLFRDHNPHDINPRTRKPYGITGAHYDHAHFSNTCKVVVNGRLKTWY